MKRKEQKPTYLSQFILFTFLVVVVASSCVPNERVIYMQNINDEDKLAIDSLIPVQRVDYKLQPNDRIVVSFFSEVPEAVAKYNLSSTVGGSTAAPVGAGQANTSLSSSFDINKDGYIEVNGLGDILAAGLSEKELKLELENQIREKDGVNDILVRVQLDGIPFTTLGEVTAGRFTIDKNEATILEALALAGDLGINADRRNIEIIRKYPDGLKIHSIDVTNREVISNPLFFIQPNDVIYVKPLKIRELGAGSSGLQNFTLAITAISGVFLIINLVQNNNN